MCAGDAENLLLADPNPLRERLRFASRGGKRNVRHILHGGNRDFTSAKPADEPDDGRMLGGMIQGGANLGGQDAACIWRTEREVTIDYANSFKAGQGLCQFLGGKRTEPTNANQADPL